MTKAWPCMPLVRVLPLVASVALSAPAFAAPPTLDLDLGGGVALELVLVRAGTFRQGSPPAEAGRGEDERAREVRLTRDYYVGRYEVTVAQWARFAGEAHYVSEAEKGSSGGFGWDGRGLVQARRYNWRTPGYPSTQNHPVTIVTYDDALAFTRWLSRRSGYTVTLPTEAQWEHAARGGTTTRFYEGDEDTAALSTGWFARTAPDGPREVGLNPPNAFGLHDMAGNVYEWCLDWYGPYGTSSATDPLETRSDLSDKPRRVLRGGSWLTQARALRSAARYRNTPGSRNADNGFRVVAWFAGGALPAEAPPGSGAASRPAALSGAARVASSGPGTPSSVPSELLIAGGAMGAGASVIAVLVLLRRRHNSVRTAIGPDGFTLHVPGARVGERLRYRYLAGGVERTGQVTVTGDPQGGVFVYTGDRPTGVEYLAAVAVTEAARDPEPFRAALHAPEPPRDEPFRGYPSAY